METAALWLVVAVLISTVMVILALVVLAKVVISAARSGSIRARGGMKVPGMSLEGEIDASAKN